MNSYQGSLFDLPELEEKKVKDLTATFADNMKMPIHKWYRYTAGFSAAWGKRTYPRRNKQWTNKNY
jgi:hypothetical protein